MYPLFFFSVTSLSPYVWVLKQNIDFVSVPEAPVTSLPQPFRFFIPQSSTAALVYSNQGAGRRLPEGIFTLEYEICSPLGGRVLSPSSDSSTTKQQQSECTAAARKNYIAHRSQVSHDSHFLPLRKKGQERGKKSKEVSPSCLEVCQSLCFASSFS